MLAHPRRIFYYIFPPYETQALFIVVLILTIIDWVCFFVSLSAVSPWLEPSKLMLLATSLVTALGHWLHFACLLDIYWVGHHLWTGTECRRTLSRLLHSCKCSTPLLLSSPSKLSFFLL